MIPRRSLLGALLLVPLAACGSDVPPASVQADDDGYHGTGLTDGFEMPDVDLTDQDGNPWNLATSPTTKAMALFFGYTNCPDICPGILADMATAKRRMQDGLGSSVTLVMVTTDPARDTPEVMKAYLERIDESFIGVTGDLDVISGIASSMGIAIEEGKKLPSGGYEVDHGSQILGVGADHRVQVIWTEGYSVKDLREDYATLISRQ
ncbi:SCO family protein [Tessaracoccus antarcticus]|uniref:SCO family protein n=1 Tax=Tessaracoccus antarcticus TaxID=2479848 RepID=A0A3M0G1I7_9ACTN|nr:SCO family protein [Tessaracoccus antarcticus]RMB58784.1 SCO family protein [Tessaracoccus antarcticus]